tara:strand:+ start:456 stop:632 length:177 start_codon:yes stop_codon:yes gene_type:complete
MTLYAVSHVTTGNPASDAIFGSHTFFEKKEQAQRQLDNYKDGYQKFYEVRSFNITPQS